MCIRDRLTPGSKISSLELEKFYQHKVQSYQTKLDDYFRVLSDIESAILGINNDVFGSSNSNGGESSTMDMNGLMNLKTGLNTIVSTVIEEFGLFMDTAERIAELRQKVREITGSHT